MNTQKIKTAIVQELAQQQATLEKCAINHLKQGNTRQAEQHATAANFLQKTILPRLLELIDTELNMWTDCE